ncbi:MAG TPA: lipopolysaccharide biosynthesis protein [Pseudolysinimonas sp.]|jgi:O-antigen/teichoic acid export membrane protein|nr:lipopolysaccharide biosynthesis protein [Pseudolysinimonas sp.]
MSETPENLNHHVKRSVGWIVLERWSTRVADIVVFAVLARLLTPADFGTVALATVFVTLLTVFVESGFTQALIRELHLDPRDASTAFWTSLGISVVAGGALSLSAPLIATWLNSPDLRWVLPIASLALPLGALSQTPGALLEREFQFRPLSLRRLVGVVSGLVAALALALAGAGIWALVANLLIPRVVGVIVLWASTPWRPRLEYSLTSLRRLWRVGSSMIGVGLLEALQSNVDKLVIGSFFSAHQLGYYVLAQRIGGAVAELVVSVVSRVALTTFSRVQDDPTRLSRIYRQMSFVTASISTPVFALVAALSPQIVPTVFGPGWEQSIVFIWILAPVWLMSNMMAFDKSAFIAVGRSSIVLRLTLAQTVLSTALVFAFVPLGVLGVAFSRAYRILIWPARLVLLRRHIGLPIGRYLWQVARSILAMIPVALVVLWLQQTAWAQAPASFWTFALPVGALATVAYTGFAWAFADRENRTAVIELIRTRTRSTAS